MAFALRMRASASTKHSAGSRAPLARAGCAAPPAGALSSRRSAAAVAPAAAAETEAELERIVENPEQTGAPRKSLLAAAGLAAAAAVAGLAAVPGSAEAAKAAVAVAAPAAPGAFPTFSELSGVAMVTAGYVAMAMNFMPLGPTAGMTGQTAGQVKWGDRTFLNMMEHAPTILPALWAFALFVSAAEAAKIGAIYLALRLCYPIIWAVWGGAKGAPMMPHTWFLFGKGMNLFYCTFPMYGCVMYMAVATLLKLCPLAIDLNALVVMPAVVAPLGFGLFLYHFALGVVPLFQKAVSPLFKEA